MPYPVPRRTVLKLLAVAASTPLFSGTGSGSAAAPEAGTRPAARHHNSLIGVV